MSSLQQGQEMERKFFRKQPTTTYRYEWQDHPGELTGHPHNDWAAKSPGYPPMEEERGVTMHGTHLLHHCSRTQVGVTLSSEAELDAALTMTYSGLSQFCSEFGHSSAVKSILARRGCGEVKKQWLQEQVCSGKIEFQKFLV